MRVLGLNDVDGSLVESSEAAEAELVALEVASAVALAVALTARCLGYRVSDADPPSPSTGRRNTIDDTGSSRQDTACTPWQDTRQAPATRPDPHSCANHIPESRSSPRTGQLVRPRSPV